MAEIVHTFQSSMEFRQLQDASGDSD